MVVGHYGDYETAARPFSFVRAGRYPLLSVGVLVGFSFSSEGTGQNDTHQRSTGLLLLLLTLKYDLMQIFW